MSTDNQGFSLDPNEFESPMHSLSLDTLLDKLPQEDNEEGEKNVSVSFRSSPIGVLPGFTYLSRTRKRTRAEITKITTRHGWEILKNDYRMTALGAIYNSSYERAFAAGDKRLLKIVENTTGYSFYNVSRKKTSISIHPYLSDLLETQAEICGVDKSQLVLVCNCLSLVTASGFQGWSSLVREDITFFWDWIQTRQNILNS